MSLQNVSDIIISPATVWIADEGEALPDETTIEFGDDWGGNWSVLGATAEALTLIYEREEVSAMVQQYTGPVKRVVNTENYHFETVLAELAPANLEYVLNGTNTNTPAGASQRAFDELKAGGKFSLPRKVVGVEGRYVDSSDNTYPVRAFLLIATVNLNGNLQFSRSEQTGIPFRASALADSTATAGEQMFRLQKVTAGATTE